MALLILDESSLVLQNYKKFKTFKNAAGYHPGPVLPSKAEPAHKLLIFDSNQLDQNDHTFRELQVLIIIWDKYVLLYLPQQSWTNLGIGMLR